ncbi:hypothetical protein LUZ63_018557 [Rhynchospora breviuscula]|uniref:Uncharacterized protein n=1 Tax=Rhynchospora breviuscula TaxID=2022672 RepID=A0A9Q0C4I4_9POAL|nr:hypothetical protein LUZ63_018557 [Rhynchospora breviuscula]
MYLASRGRRGRSASLAVTIFLRIDLNYTARASLFFLSKAWPRVAPTRRCFIVTVGTKFSRWFCPAITSQLT